MAAAAASSGAIAPESEDDECLQALNDAELKEDEAAIQTAKSLSEAERKAHYDEAVRQLNEMLSKAEQFNATCEKLASESPFLAKSKPADFVGGELRDYQQAGVEWMSTKHWLGESGIIADEMCLGKTGQIIEYVAWMRAKPVQDGPVLVVVPLSTLRNWVNEFQRFAPSIPVLEYHGTPPERAALRRKHIPGCPSWAAEEPKKKGQAAQARRRTVATMTREERCAMPVFVTTYSIAMNDSALLGKCESQTLTHVPCKIVMWFKALLTSCFVVWFVASVRQLWCLGACWWLTSRTASRTRHPSSPRSWRLTAGAASSVARRR
jgi:SNF2 family DNA or RNA helicase